MRSDNSNFADAWRQHSVQAQFVFKIEFATDDVIYLTSGVVTGMVGDNVYFSTVTEDISGTSQKISPEKSVSTIGEIRFSALDDGLTEIMKTKLDGGIGLRGKTVTFYVGEAGVAWADFVVATTQVIKSVELTNGIYSFICADVQRELRKEIFDVKKTSLSVSAAANDAVIQVYSTNGFELVRQPLSPSGIIDAPGALVGYIKLSNGCIVRYTGLTANTFTGCTWGVLDTQHLIAPIDKDGDSTADNAPKVEEYIYREGPAVMLAYELMTGACWGFPGEYLPDHWCMSIPGSLIRTADFQLIGDDWWDTTDNDKGIAAVISGVTKTDGKKFIEEQIYTMLGAFSPIYANGELGLRRLSVVHSTGSYVRLLTPNEITDFGTLTHDMDAVINEISIKWNYVPEKKEYTRLTVLRDTASISKHGKAKPKELSFKTLASSRHSYDVLRTRFDSLRDRFAGPPLRLSITLLPRHNDLEVGDVVRVQLPNVKDYTGAITSLDRNFEIQQVATDWKTGHVTLQLFGSSQPASPISTGSGNEPSVALSDGWYTSAGTEINLTNFPGALTIIGSLTRISSNITLTGAASNKSGIYYCNGDLTIDSGVTVTITDNVYLRVKGFLQVNGTIDGEGQGVAGQDSSWVEAYEYIGNPVGGAGLATTTRTDVLEYLLGYLHSVAQTAPDTHTGIRAHEYAPYLSVSTAGNVLEGVPTNLRGTPGPRGGSLVIDGGATTLGGNGGAGGAGMVIVCRGADIGAAGKVDTSGIDGALGTKVQDLRANDGIGYLMSGAGGGGYPGAVYWLIDGATNNAPSLNSSNSIAEAGASPLTSALYIVDGELRYYDAARDLWTASADTALAARAIGTHPQRVNTYQTNHRIQFLVGESTPEPERGIPSLVITGTPPTIVLSEATNTPASAAGNLSTIEVSIANPPTIQPMYSHPWISYRVQGASGWTNVGPASPEALFIVPSNGETYEVRAQAVSIDGQLSEGYITNTITVSDISTDFGSILVLPAPAIQLISGLTTFSGRDAHFIFTDTAYQNEHFAFYEVKVYSGATLLRTEQISDRAWSYTSEKNFEDGNHRTFTVKAQAVTPLGNKSTQAEITVSNPAPTTTLNSIEAGFKIVKIYMTAITDTDWTGWKLYGSTTNGFTPGPANLVYQGTSNPITVDGLADGTTYYYRIQATDAFGDGTMESQRTVTTQSAITFDYGSGEIETGEVLEVSGTVVVTQGTSQTIIGPVNRGSFYSMFHAKLGTTTLFDIREGGDVLIGDNVSSNYVAWDQSAGTLTVRGNIQATSVAASVSMASPTITGGLIRTASSGRRIELNGTSGQMTVYDAGGNSRCTIDDSSGSFGYIYVTGDGSDYGFTAAGCSYGFRSASTNTYGAFIEGVTYGAKGKSVNGYGFHGESTNSIGTYSTGVHGLWGVGTERGLHGQGQYGVYLIGSTHDAYLGGTGTVGPFTGAHEALLPNSESLPYLGDIVVVTGIAAKAHISNTIPYVKESDSAESKAVYGVVSAIMAVPDSVAALNHLSGSTYSAMQAANSLVICNGLGEGQINVCDANGDFAVGDFICTSAVAGKGKRYDGNDMRVVVAKALEPVVWADEPEATKMIVCVYMCS